MCSVLWGLFPILFFLGGGGGTVLISIVNKRLIQIYGWSVSLRYGQFRLYRLAVLSKSERWMLRIGWALIGLMLLDVLSLAVWQCRTALQS
jgi:hypothetical protein